MHISINVHVLCLQTRNKDENHVKDCCHDSCLGDNNCSCHGGGHSDGKHAAVNPLSIESVVMTTTAASKFAKIPERLIKLMIIPHINNWCAELIWLCKNK